MSSLLFHADMRSCEFVADRYGSLLLSRQKFHWGEDPERRKIAGDTKVGFSYIWGNEIEKL